MPWDEFLEKKKEFLKSRILKDEYPGSKATEGIVELLRQSPGIPWGLTWNGGIALTVITSYSIHYTKLYD